MEKFLITIKDSYFEIIKLNGINLQFISVINQLDAQNFYFAISLFHASTCFERHVLIIRRSELRYTASVIITPTGGRLVHRLRETATCVMQF